VKVEIINNSENQVNESELKPYIHAVYEELKKRDIQLELLEKKLTVVFVDEEEVQKLNKKFRKKDSVTDILSFSPLEENSLGELVLCLSVASGTKTNELSDAEWLYYLILHGILHLLGFDHEQGEAEAREMYCLQDAIFEKLSTETLSFSDFKGK
jgi:probable rRNA maturation factor